MVFLLERKSQNKQIYHTTLALNFISNFSKFYFLVNDTEFTKGYFYEAGAGAKSLATPLKKMNSPP